MMKRRFFPGMFAVCLLALTFMIGGQVAAQTSSGTPSASPASGSETAHPAHIHSGSCEALGDVVYPLTDVTEAGMMSTPMAGMASPAAATTSAEEMAGSGTPMAAGDVVAESTSTVQVALADISTGGFAINVHESMDQIQNYIACGDITGTPANNMLQIPLNELNNSGYYGIAELTDNGDGTTTVVVRLAKTGGMATPVA